MRASSLRSPRAGGRGRVARAHGLEARRADRARARAAATLSAGPPHARAYPPRSATSMSRGTRSSASMRVADRGRAGVLRSGAEGARGRRAHPGDDRALPLVGPDRPAAPARGRRRRSRKARAPSSSPTPAPRRRSGTRRCSRRDPDWAGIMALHHGSLDRKTREWVEDGLREGKLRCVVCTSTLDLGVDFTPVDRVIQVGSPKSVGRLIQRAGRSGHQPGAMSRLTCVPTNALELVDVAAARSALEARADRGPPPGRAAAGPPGAARGDRRARRRLPRRRAARRRCARRGAYRDLRDDEWRWVLDFITRGGQRAAGVSGVQQGGGRGRACTVVTSRDGRDAPPPFHRHDRERVGDEGAVPPRALARLGGGDRSSRGCGPGDHFTFAGPAAAVRRGPAAWWRTCGSSTSEDRGRAPLVRGADADLPAAGRRWIRIKLDEAGRGSTPAPRWRRCAASSRSRRTGRASRPPTNCWWSGVETREGHHLFFYPVEGRLVHEGLAALFAYRIAQLRPDVLHPRRQ